MSGCLLQYVVSFEVFDENLASLKYVTAKEQTVLIAFSDNSVSSILTTPKLSMWLLFEG